jgi:hypothetical protein
MQPSTEFAIDSDPSEGVVTEEEFSPGEKLSQPSVPGYDPQSTQN